MTVDGAEKVAADFSKAAREVPRKADGVVDKVAKKVEAAARSNVPKRTGALAGSINTTKEGDAKRAVGSDLRYARYVEYGTYKDRPQPYLFPAASQHGGELAKEMMKLGGDI